MANAFFQVDFKYFLLFQPIIQPFFKWMLNKLSGVGMEIGFEELPYFFKAKK